MQTSSVTAYVVSAVVLIIMFLLALVAAQLINFEPDKSDVSKRRVWFWICAVLTPVLAFCVNYFVFYQGITVPTVQDAYMLATSIGAGVMFVIFILLGWALSKNTNGKLSSWF